MESYSAFHFMRQGLAHLIDEDILIRQVCEEAPEFVLARLDKGCMISDISLWTVTVHWTPILVYGV